MINPAERIPCFFLEATDRHEAFLERSSRVAAGCPSHPDGMHRATVRVPEPLLITISESGRAGVDLSPYWGDYRNPLWPEMCACGYAFTGEDSRSSTSGTFLRRADTREFLRLRDAPPGALWFADWYAEDGIYRPGPDGHVLMCKTPGGDWCIDSRASNCQRPEDNLHHCWLRDGDPTDPLGIRTGRPLTVGKQGGDGNTCSAGAGSIQCGAYHGFLTAGYLHT